MKVLKLKAKEVKRVDLYLSLELEDYPREKIKKMIQDGLIVVNGKKVKPSFLLKEDDLIEITLIEQEPLQAVNLNLDIVYEDDDIIVIYKPVGLIVHPSASTDEVTLVSHLLYHTESLSYKAGENRPGIVHRLDKDTSGLLVVAKTDLAYDSLVEQFKDNKVKRVYEAICYYPFNEQTATIDMPIARDLDNKTKMAVNPTGKRAITYIKVLNQNDKFSYIECRLHTGRTHQIRVHLSHIGHPIVGDQTYGIFKKEYEPGQLLHAKEIGFIHPKTKKEVTFTYSLPEKFKMMLNELKLK